MKFKKWLETTEDEFLQHHKTGSIAPGAYEKYEKPGGLSWLGPKSKFPELLDTRQYGPHTVEFRRRGEKVQYNARTPEGDIARDERGMALSMSDDEVLKAGLPLHDTTIVAFVEGQPIGMASNEFGTIGVWVEGPYQRLGIGSDLMVLFMEKDPRFLRGQSKIGQMTDAGENMSRAAYRKLASKYRDQNLIPQAETS